MSLRGWIVALLLLGGAAAAGPVLRDRLVSVGEAAPPEPALLGIPGTDVSEPPMKAEQEQLKTLLRAGQYQELERRSQAAIADYKSGRLSDVGLRNLFAAFTGTAEDLRPGLDAWILQYPRSYPARLARGIYHRSVGGERRGEKFIAETPPEKIAAMHESLALAMDDLQTSLAMDERPVLSYLYLVSVGKFFKGQAFLERQMQASLRTDPKNFVVRRVYFRSLRPRWGGSIAAMEKFLDDSRAAGLTPSQISELEALLEEEKGWLAERGGRKQEALGHYLNAVRAFPDSNDNLWLDLARMAVPLRDCKAALPALTRVVAAGDDLRDSKAWAHASRAWCLGLAHRHEEAVADLRAAADLGDAWSQSVLGDLLYHGRHVPRDPEAAMEWFRKSADQGNADAIKMLAGRHEHPQLPNNGDPLPAKAATVP